jgi:peptide-methionine (R)-S-oxide reductase
MKDDAYLREEERELYHVAREQGTEPPFIGKYVHTTDKGVYACAVCGAILFSSDAKYDSGSGWPSFTTPVMKEAVILGEDMSHNMFRTEVRCAKCNAHLGHVFPDGPKKNDSVCDRYCINSISLELHKDE